MICDTYVIYDTYPSFEFGFFIVTDIDTDYDWSVIWCGLLLISYRWAIWKATVIEDTGWEITGLTVLSTEDMKNLSLKNGWIQP